MKNPENTSCKCNKNIWGLLGFKMKMALMLTLLFGLHGQVQIMYGASALLQESVTITGKVTDVENGQPLAGANVVVVGTTQGVTTDFEGMYSLTVQNAKMPLKLEATYIGYAAMTATVTSSNGPTANFALQAAAQRLNDVVVTASKRGERLQDVPVAIQAISSEAVEQIGLRDINEVMAFVPGASEDLSFGAGLRQYQLRGIPQGPGDPTIGYYMDDIPFNFFGFQYAPLGRTFDVERVEVLRGPQSTLYGAGAMGGVMKFVSKRPDLYDFGGEAVTGTTLTAGGNSGFYGDLALNLPIIKEKLALRLTGSYEKVAGFADNDPVALQEDAAENVNGADVSQFRAQLLYKASERLEVKATYMRNQNEQTGGNFLSQLDPEVILGSKDDFANVTWDVISGTFRYDFDFATLTSTTSAIKTDALNSTSFFLGDVFGTGQPIGVIQSISDNQVDGFNHETRLVSRGDGPFKWLAGFYFVESDVTFENLVSPELAFFPPTETLSQSVSPSFFGEASYGFLDNKLTALFGLRLFRDRRTFTENGVRFDPVTFAPINFTDVQQNTFSSTNPRFNLSYRPNQNTNVYVNVAKGFRGGKFNTEAVVTEHNAFGLPATNLIESDEIWSYEVGTKLRMAEDQLTLELAAYRQNWNNAILQFAVVSFADYNAGDVLGQGLDVGLAYAPTNTPWTFIFTGNINSTEFEDIRPELLETIQIPTGLPDPAFVESQPLGFQNGDAYPFVPDLTLAGSINYDNNLGTKGWRTSNTLSFSYRGEQPGNGDIVSDPLSLLRLRFGVSKDNFGITLFGNNLLNDRDSNYAQRTPALTAFTPAFPRQIGVEVRYGF